MDDPYTPESFVTEFWSGVSGHDIPDEQQDRLEATVKALAETQKLLREANASGLSDMIVQRNRAVERAERAEAARDAAYSDGVTAAETRLRADREAYGLRVAERVKSALRDVADSEREAIDEVDLAALVKEIK